MEEYRNVYQKLRRKLLDVNLNAQGLRENDRELLVSCSEQMKSGLGLPMEVINSLSKVMLRAYHPDTNPEVKSEDTRDVIEIKNEIKILKLI